MSESESVDSPAFVRQRRNLIVTSVVLFIAMTTNLTITKLNFFGLDGTISRPVSIVPYLWGLCVYFLWRYWIAFSATHETSTVQRYIAIKKTFLEPVAVAKVMKQFEGRSNIRYVSGEAPGLRAWMPHPEELVEPKGVVVLISTNVLEEGTASQKNFRLEISPWELRWAKARTIWNMIATADEFSEYYLPFVVAAVPLVLAIGRWLAAL